MAHTENGLKEERRPIKDVAIVCCLIEFYSPDNAAISSYGSKLLSPHQPDNHDTDSRGQQAGRPHHRRRLGKQLRHHFAHRVGKQRV